MDQATPLVTPVLTMGPGEGPACASSLHAMLGQAFERVLLVDHGAREEDRQVLPADPRLRLLRMAPASRATARNRGLAHAGGRWLWVLAPGDRPAPHAMATLARLAGESETPGGAADVLFLPGVRPTAAGCVEPLSQSVFDSLTWGGPVELLRTALALLPPAAPMRLLRAGFVARTGLRFADDLGGGALPLATGALLEADRLALADLPLFCRGAPAAPHPAEAMAAAAAAGRALALLGASRLRNEPVLRLALLGGIGHHLAQQGRALATPEREGFQQLLTVILQRAPAPVHWTLQSVDPEADPVLMWRAPWLAGSIAFLRERLNENR